MNRTALLILTASLWTAAATLLIVDFFELSTRLPLAQLALFVQAAAFAPTLYLIGDHLLAEHRRKILAQMCEVIGRADAERLALHPRRSA